ncbi:MAG: penicillin acylase family protein [Alphaproteobacteria bacterium]|nr:penicillin acylase family protein [Alphaproteobacteria bacterium]
MSVDILPEPESTESRLDLLSKMAPNFTQPVTIYWDKYMIPFISAQNDQDAAMALGLVHAHLRLGQMEIAKRLAYGRISEMAGPFTTNIDSGLRALGFARAAQDILKNMPSDTHQWLNAYVAGVNYYKNFIKQMPHEMRMLNMDNEPWTAEDTIAIGRLGGIDVNWLMLSKLLPERTNKNWSEIWKTVAHTQGYTLNDTTKSSVRLKKDNQLSMFIDLLQPFIRSGSNSFAVAPNQSQNGAAMIANDPHLGFSIPNFWIIVGLQSPTYHVVGMMPTGIPVFAFGRNEHIAWGGTNMRQWASDIVDVTNLKDLSTETHLIKRRGWFDTIRTNRLSPYGPVISDTGVLPFPKGRDFAVRWTGHLSSDEITAMLGVMKAKTWQEMKTALLNFSVPGQNFIFADTKGNIGHILGTWIPNRNQNFPNDLWVTTEESDKSWAHILKVDKLPFIINPDNGVIASSNNNPALDTQIPIGWFFSPKDRIDRIYDQLTKKSKWTAGDLKKLQQDVYSESYIILRNAILNKVNVQSLSNKSLKLWEHLKNWDGNFDLESQDALLIHDFTINFADRFYDKKRYGFENNFWKGNSYLPRILADEINKADQKEIQSILNASLEDAYPVLKEGKKWGDIHHIRIEHMLSNMPLLGNLYRFQDFPISGTQETIMKTSGNMISRKHYVGYGSQARHVSDLSNINANDFILFGGQDGQINAENFIDQVPMWQHGDYIRVPMDIDLVQKNFSYHMHFGRDK